MSSGTASPPAQHSDFVSAGSRGILMIIPFLRVASRGLISALRASSIQLVREGKPLP